MRPQGFTKDGATSVKLTKSETARILEGSYISMQVARNLGPAHAATKELLPAIEVIQKYARQFGSEHVDEKGEIKTTPGG